MRNLKDENVDKKSTRLEKTRNMFSTEIESFRVNQGISVNDFCHLSHICHSQYSKYINGRKPYLSIIDALRLLATFPKKLSVNKLLKMTGEKPLKLSNEFPGIMFSKNKQTDDTETEKVFMNFIAKTAYDLFAPDDAICILSSFLQPYNDDEFFLPMKDTMITLMSNLMRIRKKKYSCFNSPRNTVVSHFQRSSLPVRFSNICGYERLFRSGGIYLLSEILYLNERKKIGLKLCQKDNM